MSDNKTTMEGKVLGIEFTMTFPFSDAASFDAFMGKPGACYDRAVMHFIAHSYYTRVRAEVVRKLAELTGIERLKESDENGKSVKFKETEETYMRRVMGEFQSDPDRWNDIMAQLKATAESVEPKAEAVVRSRSNAATRKIAEQIIKSGQAGIFAEKRGLDISGLDGADLVEAIAVEYGKAQKEAEEAQKRALGISL